MKKFKVLIIEDQRGIALAITRAVKGLLTFSEVEIDFVYATRYEEARIKIMSDNYDLISLDGILEDSIPSFSLISTILGMHKKAVVFFLSSSAKLCQSAKEAGVKLTFLKGNEEVLESEQLIAIKHALIDKSLISYEVLYQELIQPTLVFFDQKATDEDFLAIIKILNRQEINFAIVDRDVTRKIFIDNLSRKDMEVVIKNSGLDFWISWTNVHFQCSFSRFN